MMRKYPVNSLQNSLQQTRFGVLCLVLVALATSFVPSAHAQTDPVIVMQSADANTLDPTMNRETSTFNVL